ncbi:LysE family translocator [Ferrimonas marina]|uniref:Threonine/homoserine/homoserine lactone efflux protein n=1 Tax=Ferrimonas marina TaxID=299255 RepID=A0A1M5YHV9_9GAMM|nr:LysE family translocator [Ferrimonas marina]SHI11621.1 Threonine/homoserine/homoserine lactone efflux protein [Ferrimonas marina]
MTLELYLVYLATVIVLLASPGPMTLMTLSTSVRFGHGRALATILGSNVAGLVLMLLSATGIGALITSQPVLYELLRYGGAGYLIWLGIQAWRSRPSGACQRSFAAQEGNPLRLFRKALLMGLANPKGLLFFAALFPQFLRPESALLPQLLTLCLTFTLVDFLVLNLVALGGCRLANLLAEGRAQTGFNRACGAVFMGLGGSMVALG